MIIFKLVLKNLKKGLVELEESVHFLNGGQMDFGGSSPETQESRMGHCITGR
jgi:hypothetical protein